jgi:predicted RNase H-like nuclease
MTMDKETYETIINLTRMVNGMRTELNDKTEKYEKEIKNMEVIITQKIKQMDTIITNYPDLKKIKESLIEIASIAENTQTKHTQTKDAYETLTKELKEQEKDIKRSNENMIVVNRNVTAFNECGYYALKQVDIIQRLLVASFLERGLTQKDIEKITQLSKEIVLSGDNGELNAMLVKLKKNCIKIRT